MQNMSSSKTALGLDGNVAALLGYLIPLVALIELFIEKDNKFARYHAIQSLLWVAVFIVGIFAVIIIGMILGFVVAMASETLGAIVFGITGLLYFGIFIAYFGGLIYAAIKAFGGNMFKLPVIGKMAEKWAN